jgi:hypothetical protein
MPRQTLAEFASQHRADKILIVVPDNVREQFLAQAQNIDLKLLNNKEGFNYYYIND